LAHNYFRVIIAGGGTGGHLFPAMVLADALKKRLPETVIHFVGSKFGIESNFYPNRSETSTLLNIRGLVRGFSPRGIGRNISFPFRFLWAYSKAKNLISTFLPDVVIGTGGYASGLPLLAAVRKGIPTLIHEQNSYPGFTTRWLSSKVSVVCLSYEDSRQFLKKKTLSLPGIPFVKN